MAIEFDPELHTVPPDRCDMADQPKWRLDFPIDSAQDAYVARRDFTKFLGLTSLAFVVGQFWIALQNVWRKRRGSLPILEIAHLDDLPVNSYRSFHYPTSTDPAILVRLGQDEFVAYSSECTHLQCPVLPDIDRGQFHCPCHAGYFDMRSGRPLAGPPRRPLARITLKTQNATIYATGVERSRS
jgi:Rieske Fe-S protein